jgi:hypothetical protein
MRACTEIRRLHPVTNVTDFADGAVDERADLLRGPSWRVRPRNGGRVELTAG